MLVKQTLKRFAQILEQMEAVGNLYRSRRSTGCAISILGCAVTADNFDARVMLKPVDQRIGSAVGKQVNRLMTLKVDQDGAKYLAFA